MLLPTLLKKVLALLALLIPDLILTSHITIPIKEDNIIISYFGEGMKHYSPMLIDIPNRALYVGSMNSIARLNLLNVSDISEQYAQITILPLKQDVDNCISKFGLENQGYDCQNHFRVLHKTVDGKIYGCSTGSHSPKDYLFSPSLDNYVKYGPDGSGIGKCPFDPRSSHAYVYSEFNNPFNQSTIYSGTYRDSDKLDAMIYRPPLYESSHVVTPISSKSSTTTTDGMNDNADDKSKKQLTSFVRTVSQSLKVLNEPEFVKAIETRDCVYFFFNEGAVEQSSGSCAETNNEYPGQRSIIVPRVARICKKDRGGLSVSTNFWATYVKTRLNCSALIHPQSPRGTGMNGKFSEYPESPEDEPKADRPTLTITLNRLRDVYRIDDDQLLALFESDSAFNAGQGICMYSLRDIEETLNTGNFIRRRYTHSAWVQVPKDEISKTIRNNRKCTNTTDTLEWNEESIFFMNEHPLLDKGVDAQGGRALFFDTNMRYSKIVHDTVKGLQDNNHSVIFAVTDAGNLSKIVYWPQVNNDRRFFHYESALVATYNLGSYSISPKISQTKEGKSSPKESERHISKIYNAKLWAGRYMYLSSSSQVTQINIQKLCHLYDLCSHCVRDPYCGWDSNRAKCQKWEDDNKGLVQSIENSDELLCRAMDKKAKIKVEGIVSIPGSSIVLKCKIPAYLAKFERELKIEWFYQGQNEPLKLDSQKILSLNYDLVLLSINSSFTGTYQCMYQRSQTLSKYKIYVDKEICSSPQSKERYQAKYQEWCKEFENYKKQLYEWQRKKRECIYSNSIA